jgi:hypothetical protein
MQVRTRWLTVLAAALVLIPAASAQASIALSGAKGEPLDTTAASTKSRFHIHLDLGGTEHIKDLTQKLPFGMAPGPSQPTCPPATFEPSDACPANTQIGITTVVATLENIPLPQTVNGRIYYLAPDPGEGLPQLGIVLEPAVGPKVFQRGKVAFTASGISTKIKNFPESTQILPSPAPPVDTRIDSLDITLIKSFLNNPDICTPATTDFSVVSYEDAGVTSHAQASFTPTGCPPSPPPAKRKCSGHTATKVGTGKRDVLTGTRGRDVILGLGGNDVLRGLKGNDLLCGGNGKDKLLGGPGRDMLLGGPGPDTLEGGPGKDALLGGAGRDTQSR